MTTHYTLGTSPLIASTIARLVSLLEVISVEHKHRQNFHICNVNILIRLQC